MTKRLFILLMIFAVVGVVAAQEGTDQTEPETEAETSEEPLSIVDTYLQTFESADLETRLLTLESSLALDAQELLPLYQRALSTTLSDAGLLQSDQNARSILTLTLARLAEARDTSSLPFIWNVFTDIDENTLQIAALNSIRDIGGTPQTTVDLNAWLASRNSLYLSGAEIDPQIFFAAVEAAGSIGDEATFSIILETRLRNVSLSISEAAERSLSELDIDFVAAAGEAIARYPAQLKIQAYRFFSEFEALNDEQLDEIARLTLATTVSSSTPDRLAQITIRELQNLAVERVKVSEYAAATNLLIRAFNQTVLAFDRREVVKADLLNVIEALGAMGTESAGRRLAQYLDLLNTFTQTDRPYDRQIVLTVIRSLEQLRFEGAHDELLYVTLLEYPSTVRDAAQRALEAVLR